MDKLNVLFFAITIADRVVVVASLNNSIQWIEKTSVNFKAEDVLLEYCHLFPQVNSPSEMSVPSQPTLISIKFKAERFIRIDSVQEDFMVKGGLILTWSVPCVAMVYANSSIWPPALTELISVDVTRFWWPNIVNRNSLEDTALASSRISRQLSISVNQGVFIGVAVGTFATYCDLTVSYFPYDIQNCSLIFTSMGNISDSAIAKASFTEDTHEFSFMPRNTNWMFLNQSATFSILETTPDTPIINSQAEFSFVFQRQSTYYMLNLFIPGIILAVLELSSFFIPPETSNRAAYAVTIMLSVIVMQSSFMNLLPRTPKPIVTAYVAVAETIFAFTIAFYAAVMCFLLSPGSKFARLTITLWGKPIQTYRLVDLTVFLILSVALAGIIGSIFSANKYI